MGHVVVRTAGERSRLFGSADVGRSSPVDTFLAVVGAHADTGRIALQVAVDNDALLVEVAHGHIVFQGRTAARKRKVVLLERGVAQYLVVPVDRREFTGVGSPEVVVVVRAVGPGNGVVIVEILLRLLVPLVVVLAVDREAELVVIKPVEVLDELSAGLLHQTVELTFGPKLLVLLRIDEVGPHCRRDARETRLHRERIAHAIGRDALLGGDDDHAVGALRTVERRRGGVLEDGDAGNVSRIERSHGARHRTAVPRGVVLIEDHSVDDIEGLPARTDRPEAAQTQFGRIAGLSGARREQAGDKSAEQTLERPRGTPGNVVRRKYRG